MGLQENSPKPSHKTMKKALLTASAAVLLSGAVSAQLPDNSVCPDFTGTDLNGNSHNLYSLLDSGYTVFIDVSATWCGPCWNYHNTHALKNLYTQYGPGTAENKVRVFFIEGQSGNTTDQITGTSNPSNACSSSNPTTYYQGCTLGDWTAGTPYPIIDDASIADLLQITYFPTIFKICPNRIITTMSQPSTSAMWNSVGSCQSAVYPVDGALLPNLGQSAGCAGSEITLTARLQNMGTTPLTTATIEARQGSTVIGSTTWSGNLNTYDVVNVDVTNFTPSASTQVTLAITSTDGNMNNNNTTTVVQASTLVATSTQVTMEVKTDNYGSETTWKLFNPNGSVFAQGGPYGNNQTTTYNWNLSDLSCYRLEFYDAYGDGFCCSYGNGYYKVMVNGATVLQGGSFGSMDKKFFRTDNAAGIADNQLDRSLSVYPNPSTGRVTVEYTLEQGAAVNVTVTDLVGKTVMQQSLRTASGVQTETIDLGNLSNGMYLLKLDAGDRQATRTITLNK